MRNSIETKIKLNAAFIYLLVAITCSGGLLYFYSSWKTLHLKKQTVEVYNHELTKINQLVTAINQAQAEVNLFVITERKKHLKQFQQLTKEIGNRIDTIKNSEKDLAVDTILTEITQLLKQKEQSIIGLTRQFTLRNPIDSLSETLSSLYALQTDKIDTTAVIANDPPAKAPKRSFWKRLFSKSETKEAPKTDTLKLVDKDTIPINQIIQQTRLNYDQHMSAIENQLNSVVLTDQYISSRISELLTMLYNQIIHLRMEDIKESETVLRKNNKLAIVIGTIALLFILTSLILILKNVNKGYAARQALEEANKRTRQIMESRHKLLLSVSHDIKTPLNSIVGYIDMYKHDGLLTDEEVTPVYSAGNHIQSLLSNLLEFSGLEKGSVALAPRNFVLHDVCKELCDMFIPLAGRKSLQLTYKENFPDDLILHSDPLKIKQILANLLSNAIKYTREGTICFETSYTDGWMQFQITDTGVGIPVNKQQDLFKPFLRIDENNALDDGNGFGLYVVKGLVELFGGTINIQSQPEKGTHVVITIPAKEGIKEAPALRSKKLLLVDDDDLFLDMFSRMCRQLGHEVTCCKEKQELEKELKNITLYNCVITDMEMGQFTGKDVLGMVRETSDLPVLLITGRSDYSNNDILSEGFVHLLSKPVNLNQLHLLIGGKLKTTDNTGNFLSLISNDKQAMQETMDHFVVSTVDNLVLLKKAIQAKDFNKAQYICHKMLPMFLLIEAPDAIIDILKHTDQLRGKEHKESIWEELEQVKLLIENYISEGNLYHS